MKNYIFYDNTTGIVVKNLSCPEKWLSINQEPNCSYIEYSRLNPNEKMINVVTKQVIDRVFTPAEIVEKDL